MSSPTIYRIRHAEATDLAACLDLRAETGQEPDRQALDGWIEQGALHVVTNQIWDVVACFALAGADTEAWTPAEAAQPALYLYDFTIGADHRDGGLGALVLDWCAQRAAETGARWLRLDCSRTDTALHRLWQDRGFDQVDVREHPTRDSGVLFQRAAGTSLAADEPHATVTLLDDTVPATAAAAPLMKPVRPGRAPASTLLRRFAADGPLARAAQEIAETRDDLVTARELAADDDTFDAQAHMLEQRLPQLEARLSELQDTIDRHDPASVWHEAAELVTGLRLDQPPTGPDAWNAALDEAARALENRGHAGETGGGAATVVDRPDGQYYELLVDGTQVGLLVYQVIGAHLTITHTMIERSYRGHGLSQVLLAQALDDIRTKNLTVSNYCPVVGAFVAKHPEYSDLLGQH